jgi:CxxC-x17-CxxC domain-containing protein
MAFGNRGFRKGGFSGGNRPRFNGPREMHKITCSECGQEAEVPFKPIEGRPVYCKDCFAKKKDSGESKPFKKSDDGEEETEEEY